MTLFYHCVNPRPVTFFFTNVHGSENFDLINTYRNGSTDLEASYAVKDINSDGQSLAEFYQDQHHLVKAIWGENFSSPVHEKLKQGNFKVLDIGILKPGGYLEIYDAEINCNNMSPLHSEFYSRNLDPLMIRNLGNIMASSKLLEDIHHEHKTIPVGEWDGVIGE
ncbi:4119_t:CDS:2 [Entrophospora sp. SA101]|nr:4119_t:CDS:2 [Entrophospora sp. SA101]